MSLNVLTFVYCMGGGVRLAFRFISEGESTVVHVVVKIFPGLKIVQTNLPFYFYLSYGHSYLNKRK